MIDTLYCQSYSHQFLAMFSGLLPTSSSHDDCTVSDWPIVRWRKLVNKWLKDSQLRVGFFKRCSFLYPQHLTSITSHTLPVSHNL